MKVFLVGGTGVVGRPLVPRLVASGHTVRCVARSGASADRLTAAGARPVRLAAYDVESLASAMRGCDVAVDLTTHVPPVHRAAIRRAWREHDWLRDRGTAAVVAAAERAGVGRVVRDSVAFAHADGGEQWIDEDWPLWPGIHLASSVAGERHVESFSGESVVLRFALLYGPESEQTRATVRLARRLRVTPVLGPGSAYQSSLHNDDAATAVAAALAVEPGTYDLGDDEPLRRDDLAGAQAHAMGLRQLHRPPAFLARGAAAETQTRSQRISAARFRGAAGWRPRYASAREGWRQVVAALSASE